MYAGVVTYAFMIQIQRGFENSFYFKFNKLQKQCFNCELGNNYIEKIRISSSRFFFFHKINILEVLDLLKSDYLTYFSPSKKINIKNLYMDFISKNNLETSHI